MAQWKLKVSITRFIPVISDMKNVEGGCTPTWKLALLQ